MIQTIKDEDGRMLAFLSWQLFTEDYVMDESGEILGILEIFIHPSLNGKAVMRIFNSEILKIAPHAKTCVYFRDGKPRQFDRRHFERMERG